jgi:RNA polymerase sigma factor (sigma-70 family)
MENRIIERIKAGDQSALKDIYLEFRRGFILYISKKYCTVEFIDEIVKDAYQEAIEILYNNIMSGKLIQLSSAKSYVFKTGEHKISEVIRKREKFSRSTDWEKLNKDNEEEQSKELQLTMVEYALNNLSESNRKILKLFYYENKDINEIAEVLGASYDSVKTMKSRALKILLEGVEKLETKNFVLAE